MDVEEANRRGDKCIVARCVSLGMVELTLLSFGQRRNAWFCERCAEEFERMCWERVTASEGEQLALDVG